MGKGETSFAAMHAREKDKARLSGCVCRGIGCLVDFMQSSWSVGALGKSHERGEKNGRLVCLGLLVFGPNSRAYNGVENGLAFGPELGNGLGYWA